MLSIEKKYTFLKFKVNFLNVSFFAISRERSIIENKCDFYHFKIKNLPYQIRIDFIIKSIRICVILTIIDTHLN